MTELKPCPFCGSKAKIYQLFNWNFYVACTNHECGCTLDCCGYAYGTEEEAAEAWNRRTADGTD